MEQKLKNWKTVRLKDVCCEILDGDWIESKDQSSKGIRLIQTGNIGILKFLQKNQTAKYISKETFIKLNCTEIFPNDILISRLPKPIGRACIIPDIHERMITAVDCTIIRTNELVNNKYLIQYLSCDKYFTDVEIMATGSTRERISRKELSKINIALPPIEEQQKISEILSTQDKLIELKQKLIDNKKQQKKWLMQNLLTGKIRLKGFEGEWKKVKLDDVCEIIGGGTPDTSNIEYWNGNIPWISSSDLKEDDIFNINIKKYITKEAVQKSSTNICPANSILLVSRVGVGKVAVSDFEICTSQDFTNIIKCDCDKLYLTYVLYKKMQKEINNLQGTSIKGITSKEIKKFIISLPALEIQHKIAEILSAQDKEIELLEKQLEQEKLKKKALMQMLLTGKVRVKI